ncbi:GNAT family N-acetyltransferase [Bacillus sp. AG4(2022)]|uniref:GNAT family N-acetyltransferase n=1 Tax=Bacillus sp. AG4(2022) TaxID=2962594 RepID=UPI002881249F|nr:GNAT family N-acetyltransferase [Bacillus sp. AG4(2022)]MDT0159019.1 GNAT family N-acetyltransferase [Bacillus sp. AG4(2022)]
MLKTMLTKEDIFELADYAAAKNRQPDSFVGYLGTEAPDIAEDLADLSKDKDSACFIHREDPSKITGFLGVDADTERGVGELWGPFADPRSWDDSAAYLLSLAEEYFGNRLNQWHLFIGRKNERCKSLAEKKGFKLASSQMFMELTLENPVGGEAPSLLTKEFFADFTHLHDSLFPATYYSGSEMLEKFDEQHLIFAITKDNELSGYLYAELDSEEKAASIEFMGVSPNERRKGTGARLLLMAAKKLRESGIERIKLCVDSANENAISLYRKMDFKETNTLLFYKRLC